MPEHLVRRFEQHLRPGERSRFIAQLIEGCLAERERQKLRQRVIEGCREMGDLYREIDQVWNPAADEVWRELE